MAGRGKAWGEEEDRTLGLRYPRLGAEGCVAWLKGRTACAIRSRAMTLGIKLDKDVIAAKLKAAWATRAPSVRWNSPPKVRDVSPDRATFDALPRGGVTLLNDGPDAPGWLGANPSWRL